MLKRRRAGLITAVAAASLAASAAPAAADSAVCELDGPVSVAYEESEPFIFDRGNAYVRSQGTIRCAGTLGDAVVSPQAVPYALRGHLETFNGCALASGGTLRLDARLPQIVSIGGEPEALTADLTPSGLGGTGSIAGIGGFGRNGLDIRGSVVQSAGWCTSGILHMRLAFTDGETRPNRTSDAAEPPATAEAPATPRVAAKPRRAAKKRCARKAKSSRKAKTSRRCAKRRR